MVCFGIEFSMVVSEIFQNIGFGNFYKGIFAATRTFHKLTLKGFNLTSKKFFFFFKFYSDGN